MTELSADYACADLTTAEFAVLRGLTSLGYTVNVTDLAEFVAGWSESRADQDTTRSALLTLDAIGWAHPENPLDPPTTADIWRGTSQGRVALESA